MKSRFSGILYRFRGTAIPILNTNTSPEAKIYNVTDRARTCAGEPI